MRQLLRRIGYLVRLRRLEADLAEELTIHRAMKERELRESGLSPSDSGLAARRALGSLTVAQDRARDVWVPRWLQGAGQDVQLAIRSLCATPVVTTITVLSLALGIGANTAIFSVVDSLVLRALPVPEPQRLFALSTTVVGARRSQFSTPDAKRFPQFDSITPGWFAAYGIPIERGRDYDERGTTKAPAVMIVNDAFVRQLLPARDVVIGTSLAITFRFALGDYPRGVRTIVGVVADSVFHSIREPVRPMIYVPWRSGSHPATSRISWCATNEWVNSFVRTSPGDGDHGVQP